MKAKLREAFEEGECDGPKRDLDTGDSGSIQHR
jgi:hypothetical protein